MGYASATTMNRDEFNTAEGAPAVVVLASRSPRRRSLLAEAGIAHESEHPGFDDAVLAPGQADPAGWVTALAYLKAWARWKESGRRTGVILGADTACVLDGGLIGTPTTPDEARRMIASFVGRDHEVVTGVALIEADTGRRHLFAESALVTFGALGNAEMERYVSGGEWRGKAGGYNLSERLAAGWPITFRGDATTIMGLPMRAVRERLAAIRSRRERAL